ncbi:OLC1v1022511C1 [Oldenlandia corymbosa var. corymbosa]|uniref:OLC1v1022511C1 n=1 Tax=Oldenlandia corymbosa var. corymbosa TaxID=529605 RepID=A0AAV1C1Q0_OLDCO|nr:OLC1v1022511C1 [Oldenlandia corymbosa var. corymbosa]
MDTLPEKLLKFKFPILIATISTLFIGLFIYLAPSFIDIVKYFWPLLVSTAMFLAAIVVFGRISPPPHAEVSGDKAGEGILDFVAGPPENSLQPQFNEVYEGEAEEEDEVALREAAAAAAKAKGKAKSDDE